MTASVLQPGAMIDGYTLTELVHRGGMAHLWRVQGPDAGFPLIMKIPRLGHGDDRAAIVGFEVEQMILPRLAGPHVPRYAGAGDFTERPYLLMEFIYGPTLRSALAHTPLPAAEVARCGARVADALHALHRQDVVHLDVKPSSVLFRPDGTAVLIDFGLAHHHRLPDLLAEEFRLPLGTGPYLSPEQLHCVRDDPRSDVYALGVTLYHLATGVRPFGNPTSIAGLRRRLWRDPVPPRVLVPELPAWLQEIILRCLEVDPDRRYPTAAQVAFDLRHPDQVPLGARAERLRRDGPWTVLRRRLQAIGDDGATRTRRLPDQLAAGRLVMVAVDATPGREALAEGLRRLVRDVLTLEADARLACVTVLKSSRLAMDADVDEQGRNLHVQALVELKHWARPLGLAADRITYHVLQAPDVAHALLHYAEANHVDHIVIGARGSSMLRRYLGSVSAHVVAEARCTVTVFRTQASGDDGEEAADTPGFP